MKYKLKNPGKSWWVKGMVVEGEINGRSEILEIDSIDICKLNVDIITKEQIIECMKYPRYGFGNCRNNCRFANRNTYSEKYSKRGTTINFSCILQFLRHTQETWP